MVFLLLVFFMTVSTLAQDSRPEISLPESDEAKVDLEQTPGIVLSYQKEEILFQGKQVTLDELPSLVAAHQEDETEWIVRASRDAPWAEIKPLLKTLQEAGAKQLRFSVFVK